jgi:hypothetical protein
MFTFYPFETLRMRAQLSDEGLAQYGRFVLARTA